MECLQTTGAFKLRGASNLLAKLAEQNCLPKQIVANSSGNHAQAVAYAAKYFNLPVTIYGSANMSPVKAAATQYYGAKLKLFEQRILADKAVARASKEPDTLWIPPFNHPDIIAGQGSATLEAIEQMTSTKGFNQTPNAIFAPCGGGGLVSGSLIAAQSITPKPQVIGVEPLAANDAARSIRSGRIERLQGTPNTLADGAATPSVGEHTFEYLTQLDDFFEVNERDIAYWTQWLQHLLKLHIEPTCAMTMQGVIDWLKKHQHKNPQHILVIISGGNISTQTMQKIWAVDYLSEPPKL